MGRLFKLGLLASLCLLVTIPGAKADEQSQAIKLEDAPAEVQKTIHEQAEGKGRISGIQKSTEDGETNYDVELIKNRAKRNFSVAADGKLASWQVFMREVPGPARKTIREQSTNATLGEIDRVMDEDKMSFEATMARDGREINFSVSADGRLLTLEVQLADTPDKVQAGIKKLSVDATISSIEKNMEDEGGDVSYDVDAVKDGKKISFSVDAEGNRLED